MSRRNLWITIILCMGVSLLLRALDLHPDYRTLLVIWALVPIGLLIFYLRTGRILR